MNRLYLFTSGTVFAIVAVGHLIRIVKHSSVTFGEWLVPMSVSWVGLIIAGLLSLWAFKLTCCKNKGMC